MLKISEEIKFSIASLLRRKMISWFHIHRVCQVQVIYWHA